MRGGRGYVQTWRRMNNYYEVDFCLWIMNNIFFYAYQRCTYGSRRVNEYNDDFFRLVGRNQLSKSENQPKALQTEGRNFLTTVHDPSSLMGECKETRKVHLMVVKGEQLSTLILLRRTEIVIEIITQ